MKKEFISVQPRSTTAKQDFVEYMNELHSCVVTKREHGILSLSSISGKSSTVFSGLSIVVYFDFDLTLGKGVKVTL